MKKMFICALSILSFSLIASEVQKDEECPCKKKRKPTEEKNFSSEKKEDQLFI